MFYLHLNTVIPYIWAVLYLKGTFTSNPIVHLHSTLEKKVRPHFLGEAAEAQRG